MTSTPTAPPPTTKIDYAALIASYSAVI